MRLHPRCLCCDPCRTADRYAAAQQQDEEQRGQQPGTQQQDAQQQQAGSAACSSGEDQQGSEDEEDEEEFHDALSSLGEAFRLMGGRRATLCVSSEVRCLCFLCCHAHGSDVRDGSGCPVPPPAAAVVIAARLPLQPHCSLRLPLQQHCLLHPNSFVRLSPPALAPPQVGCAMGCTFCATGTMGLTADLSAGEIVEQLVHARRVAQIRNIVFMVR